jgi:5'(3')-deoxyribonucleotidase
MNKYLTRQELEKMCSEVNISWFDFDDCLVDSLQADVTILNERYETNIDKSEVICWNFRDVFPQLGEDEIEELFDDSIFFEIVQLKPNAKEFILSIPNAKIISKGRYKNLLLKNQWLHNNGLGGIPFIGIALDDSKGDYINYNSILIDDNKGNLDSVDCRYKVMFETNEFSEWQKNWQGMRVKKW